MRTVEAVATREQKEKSTEGWHRQARGEGRDSASALWQMDQGADMLEEIKKEPVEEDDGTYVCFICAESVGGRDALQCSQCQSNPFHRACVAEYPGFAESWATWEADCRGMECQEHLLCRGDRHH